MNGSREFLADWAKAVCEAIEMEIFLLELDELGQEEGVEWLTGPFDERGAACTA